MEIDTFLVTQDGETLSEPVRFGQSWMLGEGAGCGKGRQVTAIILDNRLRGRKRVLWLSQSDKLLEDVRRDSIAPGRSGERRHPPRQLSAEDGDRPRRGYPVRGLRHTALAFLPGRPSRLEQVVERLAVSLDETKPSQKDRCAFARCSEPRPQPPRPDDEDLAFSQHLSGQRDNDTRWPVSAWVAR